MRICVVGAGAIGGYLGAKLALIGEEVTLIARGKHLQAIQEQGLTLQMSDGSSEVVKPTLATSEFPNDEYDVVVLTMKAHSLPPMAAKIKNLCGPNTVIIAAQNGIPWWYFHKHGGELEGRRIESVDPDGVIESTIDTNQVIGCVVYPAAETVGPGVIRHVEGNRFSLGELDGSSTERIQRISAVFTKAGLKAPVRRDIRSELWVKLWGNLAFNPISALTRATLVDICTHSLTRDLASQMMAEAQEVAQKLGVRFGVTIDQRIQGAEEVGAHKTSMLQDIETGRPTEVDALVGAVCELGRATETPTPHIDSVFAAVKLLELTLKNNN